jgi:hypothetical protein
MVSWGRASIPSLNIKSISGGTAGLPEHPQESASRGTLRFYTVFFHEIPGLIRRAYIRVDVAMIRFRLLMNTVTAVPAFLSTIPCRPSNQQRSCWRRSTTRCRCLWRYVCTCQQIDKFVKRRSSAGAGTSKIEKLNWPSECTAPN